MSDLSGCAVVIQLERFGAGIFDFPPIRSSFLDLGIQGAGGMATLAFDSHSPTIGSERFFLRAAILMTLVVVAGFSLQLGMGRSSFSAPLLVHAHAVVFMGWVVIYLLQNVSVATGRMTLHRRWAGSLRHG
jgi:hypothetical protein